MLSAAWRSRIFSGAGVVVCLVLLAVPTPATGLWPRGYLAHLPMPTAAAWSAPDTPPQNPVSMAPGIGCYLETSCPAPEVPQALQALERLPLRWARTEIPWAGVEPEPGRFEWERWDRVVESLRARDYQVLGMLCYWTGGVEPYSDAAIEEFGRYAERVARRYRGRVAAWEVWNEPNERTFWQSTPERYVRLLRAAYAGVKRGDPNALVVGGSLSGVDLVYLRSLLRLGAAAWMDRLSVHPYSFGWNPEDAQLIRELRGVAAEMRRAGKSDRLWVTEIGINLSGERRQANLLQRTWILLQQSGVVETMFWFTLYNRDSPTYPIYRADWSPKPAASTLIRVARGLDHAAAAGSALPGDLQAPWASGSPQATAPIQAWWFRRGEGLVLSAWTTVGVVNCPEAPPFVPRHLLTDPRWSVLPERLQ